MTIAVAVFGVLLAAFVKGAVAIGFPSVATPILALVVDLRTAVVLLLLPNLVMDGIQVFRRPGLLLTLRRHAVLYSSGIAGTFFGTYLLRTIPGRFALLTLGLVVLSFVALNLSRFRLRIGPRAERFLAAPVGLVAGVLGGITNVPGTPLVIYFYAIGMDKVEFIRSIAFSLIVFKLIQLVAVVQAGLVTAVLFGLSALATAVALGAFWLGLLVQDRMRQATFNRALLGCLAVIGVLLILRALR